MNVKKSAKKVFAVAAGLALVGTTVMGALAYDLSDYPAPFVEDGMAKGVIVVGENAATSDVLGAIDIAASLQDASVTATTVAGSAAVSVEGGKDFDDLYLYNETHTYDTKLDDVDLEGFVDSTFDYDDSDVDYEDYVVMEDGALEFVSSLYNDDFGKDIYAITESASDIKYRVLIDGDVTGVGNTNHDSDFEFKFLGKTVKITSANDLTDSITIESASEYYLEEGDVVTIGGHEVTLKRVGELSVLVEVDGQVKSMSCDSADSSNNEQFDEADDFEVEVESCFYIQNAEDNSASLKLGDSISKTVSTGYSAESFGEPAQEDEADWLWFVNVTSNDTTIGLDLNINRNNIDADEDDERNALAVGESIDFPEGYASITFESLVPSDYEKITVEVDNDYDVKPDIGTGLTDVWGYHIFADDEILKVDGEDTDEVWILDGGSAIEVWYKDGQDETQASTGDVTIKIDDEVSTFNYSGMNASGNTTQLQLLELDVDSSYVDEPMIWKATNGADYFGPNDDEDSDDFAATFDSTPISGTTDYDGGYVVSEYGVYFENPKAQFGSGNSFEFFLPSEQVYANVVVKSKGSVVSAGSEGGMSYAVNPIALGLGVLDTDATLGSKPMIIVGGPGANTIAAEFLGNPTREQILETFTAGKALIKYDDAKKAMLVAGWDKQETLGAAYVVSKYDNYDFTGDELEVVVTDLSNIEVNAVN